MKFSVDGKSVFAASGGKTFDPALPLVIFVHGAGMDHTVWALQTRWFAWHDHSVMAIDLPGHGKSEGPSLNTIEEMGAWLVKVIKESKANSVSLVGHSMGSYVCLAAAAEMGASLSGLALLGIGVEMPVHPDLLTATESNDPTAWDLIVSWGFGTSAHFGLNTAPGIWMQGGGRSLLARSPEGVLGKDMVACDSYKGALQAAGKVECPTLIVIGSRDQMTPPKSAIPIAKKLKSVTEVMISDCGHMIMIEKPDQTLDALISGLK